MAHLKVKFDTTIAEHFDSFLLCCKGKGLSPKTLQTYQQHFHPISNGLCPFHHYHRSAGPRCFLFIIWGSCCAPIGIMV